MNFFFTLLNLSLKCAWSRQEKKKKREGEKKLIYFCSQNCRSEKQKLSFNRKLHDISPHV